MINWSGHWHGFGPWVGARDEFNKEYLRRPGANLTDAHIREHLSREMAPGAFRQWLLTQGGANDYTRTFLANDMTPVQLGHSLLKLTKVSADRTWTDIDDALSWLAKTWIDNPPGGDVLPLEKTIEYKREALLLGSDVCTGYYTPGFSYVDFTIICCPNRFFPNIPCPLPPPKP
ncbi:hypothetical protein SAMN04489832_0448 [Micromonospora cremea]|uniref:Uncharacterized protein n=2 Tax=Micromonospora cremea TaxID=709881 RepID=A0A1N5TZM7_9ACTN|nr:hypothetical protein SAMN04489832_0448 [Micromonospora cremea]